MYDNGENEVLVECWMREKYFHLQARENPEPLFDLSDCGLKQVPSGIYSLCRVFRKEALYLQVIKVYSEVVFCIVSRPCCNDKKIWLFFTGESVDIFSRRWKYL